MKVVWTETALNDLQELREYIRSDKPSAAASVAKRILDTVEIISLQPSIGRPGRVPDTREMAVSKTPFLIPYSIIEDQLIILRILHGARLTSTNLRLK